MSEFKGTKGKWKAVNCGKHWNNKEIDNIQIQYGDDGECISDHIYCKYDALLISKAPEMLEMLRNVKEQLNEDDKWSVEQLIKQATEI
jgi:hypothetical protein